MEFDHAEKLGVLKAIDEVLRVDDRIFEGESFFISQLSRVVGFDRELLDRARETRLEDALSVLKGMPDSKKKTLAMMLNQAANADGRVQEAELRKIHDIFSRAGMDFEHL